MNILFDSGIKKPRISLILLDWTCRESFHIFEYLKKQSVSRDNFEVIWIEYYKRKAPEIEEILSRAELANEPPIIDKWIIMDVAEDVYYHKHLMYNIGILQAKSDIICIMDSDAIVSPTFIESILSVFDEDKNIVLHLDEVRNVDRKHYPFDYPSIEEILNGDCINWNGITTTGVADNKKPLLTRNYGACMCALKSDVIEIGGADEHIDYLGHVCGPYDITFRLVNNGKKEIWHRFEYLYHAWHPGTDGYNNYIGPHDGRNNSLPALEARRSGRVLPLTENEAVFAVRNGSISSVERDLLAEKAINHEKIENWKIDEYKKKISIARQAFYSSNFQSAVVLFGEIRDKINGDSSLLSYAGWSNYVLGHFKEASDLSVEALKLDPHNCIAHKTLGWIYYRGENYEKALYEFISAFNNAEDSTDDNYQEILRGKSWVNYHHGNYEQAIKDFTMAFNYIPPGRNDLNAEMERGIELSKRFLKMGKFYNNPIGKIFFLINKIYLVTVKKILRKIKIGMLRYLGKTAEEPQGLSGKISSVPSEKVLIDAEPVKWKIHRFGLPGKRWKNLDGKSFWVTGAGTGYGRSIAIAIAAAKGRVFISGRRKDKLLETIEEAAQYGIETENIIPLECDITDESSINAACDKIKSSCDSLYGLINNAALPLAGEGRSPFESMTLDKWNSLITTNVTGQWLVTRNIMEHMAKGESARIVFMSSEAGWAFTPGMGPYNVTKAALNNLASSMAEEYMRRYDKLDLQMNTVIPGEAHTEMNKGSKISPYSVVSMILLLLSHPKGGPNGMFFHRDGRHISFAYRNKYPEALL